MNITKTTTLNEMKEELNDILSNKFFCELNDYIIDDFDKVEDLLEPFLNKDNKNPLLNSSIELKESIYESLRRCYSNHIILEEVYDSIYCYLRSHIDDILYTFEIINESDFKESIERMFEYEEVEEDTENLILTDELHFLRLIEEYFDINIIYIDELEEMKNKGLIL